MMITKFVNSINNFRTIYCLSNYTALSMQAKLGFHTLPMVNSSFGRTFRYRYFNKIQYQFSSFKDEFNEESTEATGLLKEFQQQISLFQSSYDQGKYQEALKSLQRSAQIMKQVNCQVAIQYVQLMLNIVVTCKKLNSSERVLTALLEAENILDQLPEENYTHRQIVYSNLTHEYDQKDSNQTINYLQKLLQIYEKTEIESFEVIGINEKIGSLYLEQSKQELALPFYQKALELIEKIKGESCIQSERLLEDLSFIYYKLNKFEEALQNRLKIVKIVQVQSGKQSINYISHLKNVGVIYKKLNNFDKYSQSYEQALSIASKIKEQSNSITNWIRQNLGISYFSIQQFQKALPLLLNAIETLSLEKQKEKYMYFKKAIAECFKNLNEYETAKEKFGEILKILSQNNQQSCEYAYILSEIGLMHYNLDQYEASLEFYLKSLEIQEKKHGKESQTCLRIYENIAQLYYLLKNTQKYEQYLKKIEQYQKNPTKSH